MGQVLSKDNEDEANLNVTQKQFTKDKVLEYFNIQNHLQFRPVEIRAITSKLGIKNIKEKSDVTLNDLIYLLKIIKDEDIEGIDHNIKHVLNILSNSFTVIGNFPFLQSETTPKLSIESLMKSALFHTGRYKRLLTAEYDYLKLVFISLSGINKTYLEEKTSSSPSSSDDKEDTLYNLDVMGFSSEDEDSILSRKIKWNTFNVIQSFDDIDLDSIYVGAYDLLKLLTFFLILSSVPEMSHTQMQDHLSKSIARWSEFETYCLSIIRYINLDINVKNIKSTKISYEEFKRGISNGFPLFFSNAWMKIFKNGILSSISTTDVANSNNAPGSHGDANDNEVPKVHKKTPNFVESKLINDASISVISMCLKNMKSNLSITTQNLIKLYAGSESGFSIRSLESKIFKWQAPTLLLVSGKRVKNKTMKHNNRYIQFNEMYPSYFRSSESPKKDWQDDNDKMTYAVIINSPWKNSNKNNFGDEDTVILNLSPRFDFYKSVHNPVLNGKSIYFNNLGMGLGFGNSQPINKNTVKKFLPGDISLTIEANLEFAIFRHISSPNSNGASFFQKSKQNEISVQDFEDRFMISDLEVWGIGSTKELEEQRKQWAWEEKQAEARQSVNLRGLGEERAFLEMVGLVGNHSANGGSM
ncbi:DEHA2G15092p [Debaryomyces hansenii CBS767]|uniref:Restriction of telomere capping protein 5 n=1 Tax=Debaryomyces hansenii (strain ATCC 36239 / CBS 767 / BCRC 21394 / JCM 1990 / NBRC 0083 / IGC 2968) TaxID=284592 RepID=RTC5_DEBHA|nr:DEHA2G15092p [Debaryomyces hansenii CBS767]Q6BHX4.2 RecName: Full=Restriction of telomere capping protein 5 [Debaryomyces hansenii CBS767]CAG90689.2 DEHA2G15092p [Debaryomyces hansenii CBS767]|eukprot:XP_462197.2 DEHA2G15092p [Debaryomyces hansenii CBS767]